MNPTFTLQPGGLDIRRHVKYITDLTKLYSKEQKYGGGEYNILNIKLNIFYNYCKKLRILEYEKQNVFIAILKKIRHLNSTTTKSLNENTTS